MTVVVSGRLFPETAITGTLFITMTTSGGGCYRSLGSVVSSYTK